MNTGRLRLLLLLVAALAAAGSPARAASGGTVRGVVADRDGNPLPGVTVLLENPSTGIRGLGGVTGSTGEYRIDPVPPGHAYILRFSLPSYQRIEFTDIEVRAGESTVQNVTLHAALTERIRVAGKGEVVETDSATTSTTITSEFISGLPVLGRDYQDLLTLTPGVTDVDNTGNPNIHGARDTDVVTLVDGVNTTDPFTGRYGQELNVESIEEIEVITAGASAEFSRAQGGFVNIVVKSGGNDFKGTFKFFARTERLDRDGAGIDDPELRGSLGERGGFRGLRFTDLYPFLSLSGPIVRDRLWYYVAPQYNQIEDPINAGTQAYVSRVTSARFTGKTTWQITSSQKLTLTALYDRTTQDNLGLDSRVAPESGYGFGRGGPTLTLAATSILSPTLSLETTFSRFDQTFYVTPTLDPDTNGNDVLFVDGTPALGGNRDGFNNARERDTGEDFDFDGRFDVFEDFNHNGSLDVCRTDPITEERVCLDDRDRDGRLTPSNGCEGAQREDINCNGRLDFETDRNENGKVDPAEDTGIPCANRALCPQGFEPGTRGNARWDTEDRNANGALDTVGASGDTPFPFWVDRNGNERADRGEFQAPQPPDRDYVRSLNSNRISGPFFFDYNDSRTRDTLKEDVSFYVDDFLGSHDLKAGVVLEREGFRRGTHQRPYLQVRTGGFNLETGRIGGVVGTFLPTQNYVRNTAGADHLGFYLQDTYKPLANLTLGVGLRFDRETVGSHGFTPFDPAAQRREYDLLMNLKGIEEGGGDLNADGIITKSLTSDPLYGSDRHPRIAVLGSALAELAPTRFTRHNFVSSIESRKLAQFGASATLLRNGLPRQPEDFTISNNNLAPRLNASWDPWADGKSKVFASWSRLYGNLFLETVIGEEGPDTISPYYGYDVDGVDFQGIPNNKVGELISNAPPSAFQVDRTMRTPFTDEVTFGFEREIAPEVSISFTYVRRSYRDQLQDVDVNHSTRKPPLGCFKENVPPSGFCDSFGITVVPPSGDDRPPADERIPDSFPDLYINNFNFNQVFRVGNYNVQNYSSYELQFTRRLSRKWQMDASYVFSRSTGQAESYLSESGDDPALTELKGGFLSYDQRHVAKFHAIAYLPGDWLVGGGVTWSSGLPFTFVNRFQSQDNVDYTQTRRLFGRRDPNTGHFLAESRNAHRNHAVYGLNARAQKNFVIGKAAAGAFFEVYNLLNADHLRISEIDNSFRTLQAVETRDFGRRFQAGVQLDF